MHSTYLMGNKPVSLAALEATAQHHHEKAAGSHAKRHALNGVHMLLNAVMCLLACR